MKKSQENQSKNYLHMKKKRNMHIDIPQEDQQYILPAYLKNQSVSEIFQQIVSPLDINEDHNYNFYQQPLNQRQFDHQYISNTKHVVSQSQQDQKDQHNNGYSVKPENAKFENSYVNKIKSLKSPKIEVLKISQNKDIRINHSINQTSSKSKDKKILYTILQNLKKKRSSYLIKDEDLPTLTLKQISSQLNEVSEAIDLLKKRRNKINFNSDRKIIKQDSIRHFQSYNYPQSSKISYYNEQNQKIAYNMLNAK